MWKTVIIIRIKGISLKTNKTPTRLNNYTLIYMGNSGAFIVLNTF